MKLFNVLKTVLGFVLLVSPLHAENEQLNKKTDSQKESVLSVEGTHIVSDGLKLVSRIFTHVEVSKCLSEIQAASGRIELWKITTSDIAPTEKRYTFAFLDMIDGDSYAGISRLIVYETDVIGVFGSLEKSYSCQVSLTKYGY